MQSSIAGITVGVLVLQCFLYLGIKYLWNFMNLLQFLIFMQMWLITLPPKSSVFLREIQVLALLEFIPYEWLVSSSDQPEHQAGIEEMGIDRLGSNSLVDGLGVILLVIIAIIILSVLLIFFWMLARRFPIVQRLYDYLKKRLKYNALLRFVLQSTLKLQVTAATVIVYD